jgi:hypothetical protein
VSTYVINSANTWEYKTITVPGDTSGSQNTSNSIGIDVCFDLGSGTSSNTTAGSWGAGGSYWRTSSCVNWISNASATFYITGVQLEVGSVATPFERRQYGQELALAQRYYQQYSGNQKMIGAGLIFSSTSAYRWGFALGVEMRTSPTVSFSGDVRIWGGSGATTSSTTSTANASYSNTNFIDVDLSGSGLSTGFGKIIFNSATAFLSLNAEL